MEAAIGCGKATELLIAVRRSIDAVVGFAARDEACAMRGFIVVSPVQRPIAFDGGDVGLFSSKVFQSPPSSTKWRCSGLICGLAACGIQAQIRTHFSSSQRLSFTLCGILVLARNFAPYSA